MTVAPEGSITKILPKPSEQLVLNSNKNKETKTILAPLSGNIFKVNVSLGQKISSGEVVMILEAMKMETEVRATIDGVIQAISVKEGDVVQVGDTLLGLT